MVYGTASLPLSFIHKEALLQSRQPYLPLERQWQTMLSPSVTVMDGHLKIASSEGV